MEGEVNLEDKEDSIEQVYHFAYDSYIRSFMLA